MVWTSSIEAESETVPIERHVCLMDLQSLAFVKSPL